MFQSQNKDNNEGKCGYVFGNILRYFWLVEFAGKALTSNSYILDTLDAFKEKERSYGSVMIEKLTGKEDGRVDHTLQVQGKHSPCIFSICIFGCHTQWYS